MKKLIAITLAIVLVFGLCACSQNDNPQNTGNNNQTQNNQTENNQTNSTETTGSAAPTDQEKTILYTYKTLVQNLYADSTNGVIWSHNLEARYKQLKELDLTVIDKWVGTEYAPKGEVEWDYNAVLSDFVIFKDVLLGWNSTFTDSLGNVEKINMIENGRGHSSLNFAYDKNGLPVIEENSDFSLVNGQIALVEDELRDLFDSWSWGYSCYTLDGDGKIIKVQWRKGSAHDYHDKGEEANQIVGLCTPTYDAEGKKISESISFDGINVDKTITYKYDEKGRLVEIKTDNYAILYEYNDQGLLASKEKHHVINKEYWLDEFIYSYDNNGLLCSTAYAKCKLNNNNVFEEYTLADYTYVCDENGRIVSSTKTYRKDSRENPGCVYQSDFVYGDYYIFNPNNN